MRSQLSEPDVDVDPLGPARGVLIAIALGGLAWIACFTVYFVFLIRF